MIAQKYLAKGKVQGVFFRRAVQSIAEELEIFGYVRNLDTGDVEILYVGSEEKLPLFLDKVKNHIRDYGSSATVSTLIKMPLDFQIIH